MVRNIKLDKNSIALAFGGRYTLLLTDPRKVMGHDDSLPYNTEFTLLDGDKTVCKGRSWNDGWGGDSEVEFTEGQLPDEARDYISENFYWDFPDHKYHFSFSLALEILVGLFLDLKLFHGKTVTEEQYKEYLAK